MGWHEEMLRWRRVRGPRSKDRGGPDHGLARPWTRCASRGASGGEGKGPDTPRARGGRWPRGRVLPAAAPSCAAVAAPPWQERTENLGWVCYMLEGNSQRATRHDRTTDAGIQRSYRVSRNPITRHGNRPPTSHTATLCSTPHITDHTRPTRPTSSTDRMARTIHRERLKKRRVHELSALTHTRPRERRNDADGHLVPLHCAS